MTLVKKVHRKCYEQRVRSNKTLFMKGFVLNGLQTILKRNPDFLPEYFKDPL